MVNGEASLGIGHVGDMVKMANDRVPCFDAMPLDWRLLKRTRGAFL